MSWKRIFIEAAGGLVVIAIAWIWLILLWAIIGP